MVTARSPYRVPPTRSSAGLLRLLGLAMLLLGLFYTHGVHTEGSAEGHGAPGASASSATPPGGSTATRVDHADHNGADHSTQECAPRLPRQGATVEAPRLSPLAGARCTFGTPLSLPTSGEPGPVGSSLTYSRTTPVLQV